MIIVFLTCADEKEANLISDTLLNKRLIACAKKLPIESAFWWDGKIDSASEVLVMLETIEEKFEEIEREVNALHSYETPMLFSIQVLKTTPSVENWLKEELF